MKKLALTSLLFLITISMNAQKINIEYIKGSSKGKCVQEKHKITFVKDTYTRIDLYDRGKVSGPSKIIETGYTDEGLYWEKWSPRFYLKRYGIDKWNKVYQYIIQVFYDKRGENALYVWERNFERKNDSGKFLFTALGGKSFCN